MIEIDAARSITKRALELGVNFFDTANVYSRGRSEEILGKVLKDHRDDVIIATKVYGKIGERPNERGLSRCHVMRQIEASLSRLQTNYVDLYQIHRWDDDTPIEETLRTLDDLVHQSKVRYIGASSMWAWQFAKAFRTSDRLGLERFVSMQNYYNLCYREEEREMIPLCQEEAISLIPWSPLGHGFLAGRYRRGQTPNSLRYTADRLFRHELFRPNDFDILERAEEIAREKGVNVAQVALAWLIHKGVTSPIIGATEIKHVEDAVSSLDLKLTKYEINRLEELYKPHPVIGMIMGN
jgi:aryl-alcohol dehydrogenase-like predicted oxidoreductase